MTLFERHALLRQLSRADPVTYNMRPFSSDCKQLAWILASKVVLESGFEGQSMIHDTQRGDSSAIGKGVGSQLFTVF